MRINILLFFLLLVEYAHAQKTLSMFESNHGFTQIQGHTLGDSVFMTYYEGSKSAQNFKSVLVTPEGKITNLILPELHKSTLVAATQTSDSLCVYYFDRDNKSGIPSAMKIHLTSGARKISPLDVPINGQITAVFVDKTLFIVSVNKERGTMTFMELKNGQVINQQEFSVPDDAGNLAKLTTKVIKHADLTRPMDVVSPVKIYLRDNFYYVTIDYREKKISTHVVLNLNRTMQAVSRWKFKKGTGRENFASYITGNKLIRVTNDRNFYIIRYDIEKQQAIDSFLITKRVPFAKQFGTYRNDRTGYVLNNFKIKKIIKAKGSVFVTGYEIDSLFVLKLGTHTVSTAPFPMMLALGPAVQAITAMASVAINIITADNLDEYFYVTWDGNSYSYLQKPALAEKDIDVYEDSPNINMFKGYLDGTTTTYGIYKFGNGKLWLIAFKR